MGPPVADPAGGRSVRLFFAVELPRAVSEQLGLLIASWQRPDDGYRWVSQESLHLTLAFLGPSPDSRLPELLAIGERAVQDGSAIQLRVGKPGSFGPAREPRVLWLGVDGETQRLIDLQRELSSGLAAGGLPTESRPYSPHLTLARRKPSATAGRPDWPPPESYQESFLVNELVLFESRLRPTGAEYHVRARFSLG